MVSVQSFRHIRWRSLLLQPTWIAGAISVGFHGVLFAAGPTFSNLNLDTLADPDALATNRRVPLVELTPAEQQRLPDFSNSFYSLSSLDDFDTTALPPALVPSLPGGSTPTQSRSRSRTTLTDQITLGTAPRGARRPNSTVTGGTTEQNQPAAETTPDPTAASTGKDATSTADTNTESDTGAAASTPTESSAQDLALGPNDPTEGSAGNAAGQRPTDQPQSFAYNSDTLGDAWGRWLNQIGLSPQSQPLPEPLPLTFVPRQEACPNVAIDQSGLVATLVNADGKLVEGSIKLLKSTGSDGLDDWAQTVGIQAWASDFKFPEASQPQTAYLLEVFVQRAEICN